MKPLYVLGIMSGTSLDGVDICYCKLWKSNNKWQYKFLSTDTIEYSPKWKKRLNTLLDSDSMDFSYTDMRYGHLLGKVIHNFIHKNKIHVDFIASHGHTIFHQPEKGFTTQIGQGACIYAKTKIPVVSDFRSVDVALGGQGAPFVPIGDALLFNKYEFCLNLGGIANISYQKKKTRVAFDICPINMALNILIAPLGLEYDDQGKLASSGKVHKKLFKELNELGFYRQEGPKSLGKEWFDAVFFPTIQKYNLPLEDKLCTVCCHVAFQIAKSIKESGIKGKARLLITGGGAHHLFFIKTLKKYLPKSVKIIIPNEQLINYKEALIFAFLGTLRVLNEDNVLSEVTGASENSVSGAIYGNFNYLAVKL